LDTSWRLGPQGREGLEGQKGRNRPAASDRRTRQDPAMSGPGPPSRETKCRVRAAADFKVVSVTGSLRALLGWSPRDFIGRPLYEFVHPSDLSEMRRSHEDWLRSPLRQVRQYRIRQKSGRFVWIESDRQSLHDASGAVVGAEAEWHRLDSIPEIAALLQAIEGSELTLHYQPIVEVETGRLVQLEALVRWPHDGRLVPPGEFIPLAEQCGIVRPLTRWVIERALADRARLSELGLDTTIAVNVSVRDLVDPLFAAEVLGRLAVAHARPEHLVLEITESAVAENDSYVLARITQLANAGLAIALDDFGAGQSSIGRLARMPIRELKFDDSITARPEENAELFRIVTALGRDRGIRVVAEGVEREEQLATLRSFGVAQVQGFLIARPMPMDRVQDWHGSVSRQARLL